MKIKLTACGRPFGEIDYKPFEMIYAERKKELEKKIEILKKLRNS